MALSDLELSLMAFPQNWNATKQQLTVNLMLLPVGNPLAALGTGPQFAGTTVNLDAAFIAGLASLPSTTSPVALTVPFLAIPPIGSVSLFNNLLAKLPAGTTVNTATPSVPAASVRIKKALPPSYISAFPFERPRTTDVVTGDGYGCALAAQSPGQLYPPQAPPPKIIAWGQLLSYALRQPQLALALGLIYEVILDVPTATVQDGGWLYFALDTSSVSHPWVNDFTTNPDKVKSYAARIPQLDALTSRDLFAATLFPVVVTPGSDLTEAQLEAEIYDDGFAQVVHCNQPTTVDAATGDDTQITPGAETGVQIGWDDEQVTTWFNRQLDLLRFRISGSPPPPPLLPPPESPLGVLGYRIDVQQAGTTDWHSLCNVTGNLPFSGSTTNGSGSTPSGELWVSPAPVRPVPTDWVSPNAEQAWLPLYFSQWRGSSIVVHDDTITNINPGVINMPSSALTGNMTGVPPLRYGKDYNFRVRFVDLTGGGPGASDEPIHPGLAPVGFCPFRRYLPPKSLEVLSTPPPAPPIIEGGIPVYPRQDATRTITTLAVNRPHIGYPEAVFAGVGPATFTGASLAALLAQAQASGRALSVPDPDVDRFQVTVEARIPAHDTGTQGRLPGELDGGNYRVIYSLVEPFPASADQTFTLSLNYVDTDDVATLIAPPDNSAVIPIPTGRDIRIRLQPLSAIKSNYYGTPEPPPGLISDYIVRQEASNETDLFPFAPEEQLRAFLFQPGNNLQQLLAQNLSLNVQGLTFSAPLGKRVAFGASGALRNSLAADGGAITFTNQAELLDHWIVAFVIDIARDWTWDSFAEPALTFFREVSLSPIGLLSLPRTVPAAALGALGSPADRTTTRLIFFDAIKPDPVVGSFPAPLNPQYRAVASFKSAPALQQIYTSLNLPITTRPAQTPRIVATGIAESPYEASHDYSQTSLRDRHLWIEFDQPIADSDDVYFGRVLASGPDPLLAARLIFNYELPLSDQLPAPVEPPLPIDPEPIRTIFATQSSDESGLDAMTPLIPAIPSGGQPDGVHFILPLPQGISPEALDLFGFWTYEFRVGHAQKWSTAQGRYGRPVRVTGIQHPCPHLICSPNRTKDSIFVSAPYATTLLNGVRLYDLQFGDPQTVIWFMLYAQVLQTDGASYRNILLTHLQGQLLPDPPPLLLEATPVLQLPFNKVSPHLPATHAAPATNGNHSVNREPRAFTVFSEQLIEGLLATLSLPLTSPLSVLAVELLPGPLNVDPTVGDLDRTAAVGKLRIANDTGTGTPTEDPLGADLGLRRILRTSPLTQVPAIC
ncbi:hypothetical protein [Tunturiibacter lichenicola]|uniref:hypothetical protein n=1 Tax=Tunturiibacter lichenicola TaxID=2051959 RepID=UPI003D9BE0CA